METLRKGSRGESVKLLQRLLNLHADGIFGHLTEEAVKTFQAEHSLVVDGIVGPKTWAKLPSSPEPSSSLPLIGNLVKKSKRTITDIAIHCTATVEGKNYTVAQIRAIHVEGRGWSDIGYHYVIDLNGNIYKGRDVDIIGAHVSGYNSHSIGIVYVGGLDKDDKPKDTRTPAQKEAFLKLLKDLRYFYPNAVIKGHRDYSPDLNGNGTVEPWEWIKACPCFDCSEYSHI